MNPHDNMQNRHSQGLGEIETSTVYFTDKGEVEVPGPSIPIPKNLRMTSKTHLAPLWLVFPNHIFNTHNIASLAKSDNSVIITSTDGKTYNILVSDINKTWESLQQVFAEGLPQD